MTHDSDDVTEKNYRDAVSEIAREALALGEDGDPVEFARESVDGSRWVFITYRARHVLQWSDHEDAIFDEVGIEGASSMGELYTRAAFYAMLADVLERIGELRDD